MSGADVYTRLIRRTLQAIAVIGTAGSIVAALRWDWRIGLGFLLGAALSGLSFWRWQRVTESITGGGRAGSLAGMVVRLALLVGAAYAIIRYLEVNPVAVLLGLLVSAAAVIFAIVFELIYGT
jgi:hypothetical protein